MISKKSPLVLTILDGVGVGPDNDYNAVKVAGTPFMDSLFKNYMNSTLVASGEAVGLPEGLMGNSEVGHLNIGAGRIIFQYIMRIGRDIRQGQFKKNPEIIELFRAVRANSGVLHLIGLFSDGGVHSSDEHLEEIIRNAIEAGITRVVLHTIFDGRDVPPKSGLEFLRKFRERNQYSELIYATVVGRYWAMDRDGRWDRVEKAFRAFAYGETDFDPFDNPESAIEDAYSRGETDEFIRPLVVKGTPRIGKGDGVFCFNFRSDRVRQITMALTQKEFHEFDVSGRPELCSYLCMTEYKDDFGLPVAYSPRTYENIFAKVISDRGLSQLKIAETEKYPHVTFFFNGGEELQIKNEERILIPSPRDVPTYDRKPEMSANEITEILLSEIKKEKYEVIILNFANGDMVGHTGVLEAAVRAIETLDGCIKKIVTEVLSRNGEILVTADHGNCEEMIDKNGNPHTAHTTNRVPAIFVSNDKTVHRMRDGILADIAPTLLGRLGIEKPKEMTGVSLF